MLEVALADRLDEQRVALAARGDGVAVRLRRRRPSLTTVRGEQAALGPQTRRPDAPERGS